MNTTRSFDIPKHLVMEAYKAVNSNAGAGGIDEQSIEDFEKNLKDNLYKIWNRMSSGSYFPLSVRAVAIPKKNGGEVPGMILGTRSRTWNSTCHFMAENKG